ncbi:MAG: UvrD-helicase domain-containing protein [Myxococcota bacterium]|nr:UvrD-helicase domain-containing protein [Myxococcota bacterium]
MAKWQNGQRLAPGITLLEASAGTGKTFRIAHIVMRLLAENDDIRMSQVAVLTFTRAATSELKDRIRRRLAEASRCLRSDRAGIQARRRTDEVLRAFVSALSPDQRVVARQRVERAKREFDEGLISTIHGFCQRLLTQNAFETGATFGVELEASIDGLLQDIIADLFSAHVNQLVDDEELAAWHRLGADDLLKLALTAVGDFTLKTVPQTDDVADGGSLNLARFVHYVRREYDRRYRAQSKLAFEDLTRHFSERLRGSETARRMADALSGRFRAVLVDEFQDTDARQWAVFFELFGRGGSTIQPYLFLIGDPKQAIYGFRGADIRVYGAAKQKADVVYNLDQNFRTDAALLHALNGLFGRHRGAADFFALD